MSNSLENIWKNSVSLLESEFTPISFNTWIKTIVPYSMSNDKIILSVPAEFNRDILKSRYYTLIQNAIKIVTNKIYNIDFIISNNENIDELHSVKKDEKSFVHSVLNEKYTFDTFVIGSGNQFAHAASLAAAESPATAYNPLFLYGGVGLGKTHLMHAIGHYILDQNPNQKVLYVTSEKFTNELINAIKDDKNEQFRQKYRSIDVLLVDDIQFIAGKERTQEEFFHTFNALYEYKKQIIISSDKPPKEINTLEERLRSRFEWGLIADIQAPDIETRIAILKKKAQLENIIVSDDILLLIADNISSNIRELEGALNRVVAYASLTNNSISHELAKEALQQILSSKKAKDINNTSIQNIVSRYFDINPEQLKSKKRSRDISYPRQIAMYLCRELTNMSLPQIGQAFGGRDHTTVIHACDKIAEDMQSNAETRRAISELKKNITGK